MRAPPAAGPRTLTLTGAWGGGRQRFPLMAGSWLPRSRSPGCPTLRESRWEDSPRYGQNSRPRAQRSLVVSSVRRGPPVPGWWGTYRLHAGAGRGPAASLPGTWRLLPGWWGTYRLHAGGRPRACSSSASAGGIAVFCAGGCLLPWRLMVRRRLADPGAVSLNRVSGDRRPAEREGRGRRGEDRWQGPGAGVGNPA